METTFFKVFFSKKKECDWLNTLGEKGFLLEKINDSKYYFEQDSEHKFYYSIENLEGSPESDTSLEYFKSRTDEGIEPIISHGNWIYFVCKDKPIALTPSASKNNARFYLWKSIYQFFFAICGAVLCGYQLFAAEMLERLGQQGDGLITDKFSLSSGAGVASAVLNIFKRVANYFVDFINQYLKLWSKIFGENDAFAVIAIVLPIVIILTVVGSLNFSEYFSFKSVHSQNSEDTIENIIEEEGAYVNAE